MNIFEQYGIKEVADVCLYSIELDENDDEVYIPVLYLDTLKVSTVEQTAEQVSARGGLGNPELIIWDYGKEITVNLEDALYSPASMGMVWGGKYGTEKIELNGYLTLSKIDKDDEDYQQVIPAKVIVDSFSDWDTLPTLGSLKEGEIPNQYLWKNVVLKMVSKNGKYRGVATIDQICYSLADEVWYLHGQSASTGVGFDNVGRFQITKDLYIPTELPDPINMAPPTEMIYKIKHALKNVKYLERIEKCKAPQTFVINTDINTEHGNKRYLEKYSQSELTVFIDPKTMQPYEANTDTFTRKNGKTVNGNLRIIKQYEIYYKWTRTKAIDFTSLGHQIIIDAIHFPGTYRLVGETYSRSRKTGKDERFQFEIPLCKMSSENNITLEAEGDPTTFNMSLKVLRREDGVMMKLTQYSVENAKYDGYISDSTNVIPEDEVVPEDPYIGSD